MAYFLPSGKYLCIIKYLYYVKVIFILLLPYSVGYVITHCDGIFLQLKKNLNQQVKLAFN